MGVANARRSLAACGVQILSDSGIKTVDDEAFEDELLERPLRVALRDGREAGGDGALAAAPAVPPETPMPSNLKATCVTSTFVG